MSSSDDDCDIFKAVRQKPVLPVLSKTTFYPDYQSKQSDYDFITLKKPTKVAKAKPIKQSVNKGTSRRKAKKKQTEIQDEDKDETNEEQQSPKPHASSPTRELSPISKMVYEMEQQKAVTDIVDKPVAKRTRSSMVRNECPLDTVVIADSPTPNASVPKKRGRKSKAATVTDETVSTILDMLTRLPTRGRPAADATAPSLPKRRTRGRPAAAIADAAPASMPTQRSRRRRPAATADTFPTMPTNRQAIAELAARAPVLDSIDLVSSVMHPVEGFVNLDSDDENAAAVEPAIAKTIELPYEEFDAENPLIEICMWWLGEIQTYKLRKHQKFQHMFNEVAERNNVLVEDIVVTMGDHFIKPHESLESINYKAYKMISGRAIKSNSNHTKQVEKKAENPMLLTLKPKNFQLKVQSNQWKTPVVIPMERRDAFKILYIKCAEEINRKVQDIKLFFDGELLDPNDTPADQDMEGNEMIDLRCT